MKPSDNDTLTPRERLAISRHALLEQWGALPPLPDSWEGPATAYPRDMPSSQPRFQGFTWTSVVQNTARRWWRRHPANAAGMMLRPMLERQARQHPKHLIVTAAAVGAIVVLAKPWRLLSITAVAAALLKSSDVADLVTSLMQRASHHERKNYDNNEPD